LLEHIVTLVNKIKKERRDLMDLYNLRNNMRSRYFSMLEYLNNGFEIFKMFVKKHPLLVFSHFVFSTVMVLFITFPFTEQAIKMYEFAKKVNNTKMQKNININEYASLLSSLFSMLLLYALISLILRLVAVIIQKKAGLEIDNLVEAFRYNLYLSKGKRLRILLPIIMIALITFFINYALNYFTGITIGKLQNLQMLGIVTSATGGIVKTFSVLYTIIAENLVYFNVEYMDLKKLK